MQERRINAQSYERLRDKVREEIALVRVELEDAKLEGIDVEGALGFAEHLLKNAARVWTEAPTDQKRRLQEVLFPKGVQFKSWRIGTAVTCSAFRLLGSFAPHKEEWRPQRDSNPCLGLERATS